MDFKFEYDKFNIKTEEHLTTEDFRRDEKEAKERAREEKRFRKNYKFTDKDPSIPGIVSSFLALIALILVVAAIIISTQAAGNGGLSVGIFGAAGFAVSMVGIVFGLAAFRQVDVYLGTAWTGVIANGFIWLFVSTLIVIGL